MIGYIKRELKEDCLVSLSIKNVLSPGIKFVMMMQKTMQLQTNV